MGKFEDNQEPGGSQKLNEESILKNGIDKLGQNMSAWGAYLWCKGGGILQISLLLKTGTTVGLS